MAYNPAVMTVANVVSQFGAKGDGVTDDTQAFLDAQASLPNGFGIVYAPIPRVAYAINLTVLTNGTIWQAPTLGKRQGSPPASGYFKPFDPTLPVLQIGNDTGFVTGNCFKDWSLNGQNAALKGLSLRGGAYGNIFENLTSNGFTSRCVELVSGASFPVVFNRLLGLSASSASLTADGSTLYFEDTAGSYNVANEVSDFNIGGSIIGYCLWNDSAAGNFLLDGWIQVSASGAGVRIDKTGSVLPYFHSDNVVVDSASSSDLLFERTWRDLQHINGVGPTGFEGNTSIDGKLLFSETATTGSISASSTSLTVASATAIWAGRGIAVEGAGVSGGILFTTVVSVSGTTVTLANAASTLVSSAAVRVGDVATDNICGEVQSYVHTRGVVLDNSTDAQPSNQGGQSKLIAGGGGTVEPYSQSAAPIWNLGASSYYLLQNNLSSPLSVTSAVRVGTTVTLTTSGSHNAKTGTTVVVSGALESGFNGFYVVTRTGANTVTYTSAVSGNVTATGTITATFKVFVRLQNGRFYVPNLYMRDQNGNVTSVLSQADSNGNFTLQTPDTSAGTLIIKAGATVNCQMDSSGNVQLGLTAPATTATNGFPYIPAVNGTPTGVPSAKAGFVAMQYDTSANKLWIYNGGWKYVTLS